MYAVAALGDEGGDHLISSLKVQLKQVMDQVCCSKVEELPSFLVNPS
jgi:L-lactate dehydrogenase (cytochrome)